MAMDLKFIKLSEIEELKQLLLDNAFTPLDQVIVSTIEMVYLWAGSKNYEIVNMHQFWRDHNSCDFVIVYKVK